MPLLRQLEFAFGTVAASLRDTRHDAVPERFTERSGYNTRVLQTIARNLLRAHGAGRIAMLLRVEWNSRLKTAAGRADYRDKLILLNPLLSEYPGEIDRTLRHELAHILAQFRAGGRRIPPHGAAWQQACVDLEIAGEKRCHSLPFPSRTCNALFIYDCPKCAQEFRRVRRVRRALACLACCRKYNRGKFDPRFRLRLRSSC